MSLDADLDRLLASAEDTHKIDRVTVTLFDRSTGASSQLNVPVRGATFQELALFFKRFPEAFDLVEKVFGGDDDNVPDIDIAGIVGLVLQVPAAMSTLNSCFLGRPFDQTTMDQVAKFSPDANQIILEAGLAKTFEDGVGGFFGKKLQGLAKAMGLKQTSAATSSPSAVVSKAAA